MPKEYISPAQASLMRAFKDKDPDSDQEIDMQNMDEAGAQAEAAHQAQIAQAQQAAQNEDPNSVKSLWGFSRPKAAAPVDLNNMTPDQITAYFLEKNKQK